eukprot:gene22284-26883_t
MLKSAKLPPDAKTPLQKSCEAVQSTESLTTIGKLTRNVSQNPREDKFRRIRLTNEKIAAVIGNVPGALELLAHMGWEREGEEFLVLPASVQMSMNEVRAIEAAIAKLEQEAKERARARQAAKKPLDPEKARLRAQLEADRAERAARGPVTQGSVAQQIGNGSANVMTATEAGINTGGGG